MKIPFFFVLIAISWIMGSACQPTYDKQQLYGNWQVDSVYAFYNGFGYWQYGDGYDWATYVYQPNGKFEELKYNNPRHYRYELSGDTLLWESLDEPQTGWFLILSLQENHMVLRKDKPSMFGNAKEERYEIRFFSRLTTPN